MSDKNPELNHENVRKLRDFIEKLNQNQFDMNNWMIGSIDYYVRDMTCGEIIHSCNTAGCIGGWTEVLFKDPSETYGDGLSDHDVGIAFLGLTYKEADKLFYPDTVSGWGAIKQKEAIAVLDRLDEVGYVDWPYVGIELKEHLKVD